MGLWSVSLSGLTKVKEQFTVLTTKLHNHIRDPSLFKRRLVIYGVVTEDSQDGKFHRRAAAASINKNIVLFFPENDLQRRAMER